LVSETVDAATIMSGVNPDPEELIDSAKLDHILGQIMTMNTRLDL
jgi:hypothetical protein